MADVRRLVRIDVGVFHDAFGRIRTSERRISRRSRHRGRKKCRARKIQIDVTRSSNFQSRDAFNGRQFRSNFLRDLPRRSLQALGQLEADGRCDFSHLNAGRPLSDNGYILAVALADMLNKGGANPGFENVIHVAPICKRETAIIGCGLHLEPAGKKSGLHLEPAGKKDGLYFYAERLP